MTHSNNQNSLAESVCVVANIVTLRTLPIEGSKSAIVKGYYASGDGGGGTYHLDAQDHSSVDNGGSIIVAADGGRWKLRYDGYITAEQFGAKGDWNGSTGTDDSAAFERINMHLTAFGGGNILLRRRYRVVNGWAISSGNVSIDGTGTGEIFSLGTVGPAISALNASHITLRGLRSSIPRTNLRNQKINLFFQTCNYVTVESCHTDGGVAGIWTYTCNDVVIRDCIVDTPKADGIHFGQGSQRCKAIGNTVINAGDDAFSTTFYNGTPRPSDIVFANNIVNGTVWGAGVAVYSADRVSVSNNQIHNTAVFGVVVTTNAGGGLCTDIEVASNNISGACLAEKLPESYWNGTDPNLDPPITSPLHKSAMVLGGSVVKATGNQIAHVRSWPQGQQRTGVTLNGGDRITFSGNSLLSVNGDGVNTGMEPLSQLSISGNNFHSVLGVGIRCTGPVSDMAEITNNTFGYAGPIGSGEDWMIMLRNAGQVRVAITGNVSSAGRGVSVDGTSVNALVAGNYQ